MLEQIQEVVRKNLPAEVGDQLKKHLAEAESTSRRLQAVEAELQEKRKALEQRDLAITELQIKLKAAGDLDRREKEVGKRENRLDVDAAQARAAAAESKTQAIFDLSSLVFRSPRIMRQISENVPLMGAGQTYPTTGAGSKTETKVVE